MLLLYALTLFVSASLLFMVQPLIGKLAVYGVGLIGGSFALALKKASAVGQVIGMGRGRANLEQFRFERVVLAFVHVSTSFVSLRNSARP